MAAKTKQSFVERIQEGVKVYQRQHQPVWDKRQKIVKALADDFYKSGSGRLHTINLVTRYVHTVLPYLSLSNPKVIVETARADLSYVATMVEAALNQWLASIRYNTNVARRLVFNSLVGMGITRVGLKKSGSIQVENDLVDLSEPYVQVIDDCDFAMDPFARSIEECEWMGNLYYCPLDKAIEVMPKFEEQLTENKVDLKWSIKEALGEAANTSPLRSYVRLMDVWIADENRIITILPDRPSKILRSVDWGIEGGPYDLLGYEWLPDMLYPIPPIWDILDLDKAINAILNKARRQAERQKDILVYQPEALEDANRINASMDGSAVMVDDITKMKTISLGGANPVFGGWVGLLLSQFNFQAGNIDLLGGRMPASETLGQDEMLMSNASRRIEEMLLLNYAHHRSVLNKVLGLMWDDPTFIARRTVNIAGVGEVVVELSNLIEHGQLNEFSLQIELFSMQRFSPTERRNAMLQMLNGLILPLMPLMQQQGLTLDIKRLIKKIANYFGVELEELLAPEVPTEKTPMKLVPGNMPSQGGNEKKLPKTVQGSNQYGAGLVSREANLAYQQQIGQAGEQAGEMIV